MRRAWALVIFPVALALAVVALLACTSFSADDVAAGPADGGPDASGGSDGSVEAASPFCASLVPKPRFCDDFDNTDPLGFGWDEAHSEQGGTIRRDTSLALSPPSSALATISADAGVCGYATLTKRFPTASTYRLGFSVRLGDVAGGAPDVESTIAVMHFRGGDGSKPCKAFLYAKPTGAHVVLSTEGDAGATFDDPSLTRFAAPGVWTRFDIAITAGSGAAPTLSVLVNGMEAVTPVPLAQCALGGEASALVGWFCQGPPARELRLDNVVFDDH